MYFSKPASLIVSTKSLRHLDFSCPAHFVLFNSTKSESGGYSLYLVKQRRGGARGGWLTGDKCERDIFFSHVQGSFKNNTKGHR